MPPMLLDMRAIADLTGLAYRTVRNYHNRAEQRRRDNAVHPGDFPEPDGYVGGSPIWLAETIDYWRQHRAGQGAGGGRPSKKG